MGPEILVAGVVLVALVVYSLTGGADFGGGVWDLLAWGPRGRQQRATIEASIGPIWEANHVWLIVVLVVLWTCFPRVFGAIGLALHVPLTLTLMGIVLRGSAFVFRHYDTTDAHARWSLIFAVASVITPITFGMSIGAISSGTLPVDDATGLVQTDFVSSWLAPLPFAVGAYTLVLFAWLAAVYLAHDTHDADLREDFRVRGLAAGVGAGLLAFLVLALMPSGAPPLWGSLEHAPRVWGFVALVSGAAIGGLVSLLQRRWGLARMLTATTVALVVIGWGAAMFPVLVQPDLTLSNAAAPANVLWMTLGILAAGSVLLVPSFVVLYRLFVGREEV